MDRVEEYRVYSSVHDIDNLPLRVLGLRLRSFYKAMKAKNKTRPKAGR